MNKIGDLPGASQVEVLEGDASAASGMKNGDGAGDSELHAVRDEVYFDVSSALETDCGCFDKTSGEAEIEDSAAEQETSVGQKDLGLTFAGVTAMTATVGRYLVVHSFGAR